jgi:hypothetical protein
MLSYIADLQMKIFDEDELVAKGWPKHPGIKKNNVLINSLLTRRRSAIHLTGNSTFVYMCYLLSFITFITDN